MPWIEAVLAQLPPWAINITIITTAIPVAWGVHAVLFAVLARIAARKGIGATQIVGETRSPARLALIMIFISAAASVAPLSERDAAIIRHFNLLAIIGLSGWAALSAMRVLVARHMRQFQLDVEDNLAARKHVTQIRILQRVAATLIVIIALAAALMTFDGVRQYGVSLLASAGAAGLVVGLALQPLLKNLIAGIQLAITQPIRIDDALIVEGEWGNVEEITSTYVVVRLWDWRRLILPLSYFIERPFQNWTREGSALIGTVMFYVDHTLPIAEMRAKLDEILKSSALWDRKVSVVQVTDLRELTMEVRVLVSAVSAPRAFDLRCEVREKLIQWLQAEHPSALPQRRLRFTGSLPIVKDQARDSGPSVRPPHQ